MNHFIASIVMLAACLFAAANAGNPIAGSGSPKGVPTFECIGITLPFVGDDNANSICNMKCKVKGTANWKTGHALWTCPEKKQYRGSLVHLKPATAYEIKLEYADPDGGPSGAKSLLVSTWSEEFPVKKVIPVSSRNTMLEITEGGSASGYVVYQAGTAGATIDVKRQENYCVFIKANYVILRGLKMLHSKKHVVLIQGGKHDVVVEDCEITNWGPQGWPKTSAEVYATGVRADFGCERIIVQRNQIHHPAGGNNSWAQKRLYDGSCHPAGAQAIAFYQSKGHNVIRHNRCYSDSGRYFMDIICGGANSSTGNLCKDSDVYGNIVSHCWDDALEIEGTNANVRVWGNIIHHAYKAIASASTGNWYKSDTSYGQNLGPFYVWRNVIYDLQARPGGFDKWECGTAEKPQGAEAAVTKILSRGAYYFYNNTLLKKNLLSTRGLSAQAVGSNVTSKNNILMAAIPVHRFAKQGKPLQVGCFMDHNMYPGKNESGLRRYLMPAWGQHSVFGQVPKFRNVSTGDFRLAPGSVGIDKGVVIPNFCDQFTGDAPDMGAQETGAPAGSVSVALARQASPANLRFGIHRTGNGNYRVSFSGLAAEFDMKVYRCDGSLVSHLSRPDLQSHIREITWNPNQPAGIYLLQLTSGSRSHVLRSYISRN